MPKLTKSQKLEWAFFISTENGRRTYNSQCRKCVFDCKQSFRADIVCCPKFKSKRQKYYQPNKSGQQHLETN
ncbi:hypothetical protein GSF08_03785 [Clostridiaceae bacterium DONG20-135]|uniref:Uncharacterized protein n=1 Tax=Copranaerobaculum intestinale TaxID=2692629 RepID=A0A6N8U4E9_9FIRM|nr:hypothetical protein [Copranaerobaculum intestinale]MXQ73056.1 hypothetical protein [Copranaerobaculum intestinale]